MSSTLEMAPAIKAGDRRGRLSQYRRREAMWGIICASPIILGFLLWQLGPMIASLFISFTDWNVTRSPNWVGVDHFVQMFGEDALFRQALRVTSLYTLLSIPLRLLLAFAVAMLLNQPIRNLPLFRTMFYIPSIVPVIASSVLWIWLFNPDFGLLNAILRPLGAPKIQWIYGSDTALASLILMSLWDVGGMMIIFLAGLQGVPRHLYEAVEVDGGNALHRLWHVTLPMMTPTIFFNLVLGIIDAFQSFTNAYIMTQGGPNNATLFYVLYLYNKAFQQLNMGYASALAWVLFLIIAVLGVLVFRSSSWWVYYEGER